MSSTIIAEEEIHEPIPFAPNTHSDMPLVTMGESQLLKDQTVTIKTEASPSGVVSSDDEQQPQQQHPFVPTIEHPHHGNGAPVVPMPQSVEQGDVKQSESSGEDSGVPAVHPSTQAASAPPTHGSHHSHYAQYYHSYPHGHASYYYPHGAYYPPPPHGHSSYAHAPHHATAALLSVRAHTAPRRA